MTNSILTEAATPATIHVCIDVGNGYTKAALVRGRSIVTTARFPSLLRFTSNTHYVWGGFTLADGTSAVVGSDCEGRNDTIVLGDLSNGKTQYIVEMIAGVISGFRDHIPVGSNLHLHLLTLSLEDKQLIEESLPRLTGIAVDDQPLELTITLANLLAEGAGCSAFAAATFKRARQFMVLDFGSGTVNVSTYENTKSDFPRRVQYKFAGVGISRLTKFLFDKLVEGTTNGRINEEDAITALTSNTYKMIGQRFESVCIKSQVEHAISLWLAQPQLTTILKRAIDYLDAGGSVACCGGGFKIAMLRDAVETAVLANVSNEAGARFVIPDNCDVLSVVGTAKVIANNNRKQQAKEDEANGKPKPQRKPKQKKAEPGADSLEPISAVEGNSGSEPATVAGVGEPGTQTVANNLPQQPHQPNVGDA